MPRATHQSSLSNDYLISLPYVPFTARQPGTNRMARTEREETDRGESGKVEYIPHPRFQKLREVCTEKKKVMDKKQVAGETVERESVQRKRR